MDPVERERLVAVDAWASGRPDAPFPPLPEALAVAVAAARQNGRDLAIDLDW